MKTIANTDWFLRRGIEHTMTEDYALTNSREPVIGPDQKVKKNVPGPIKGDPFAIVCDGCSSSPHTDIGARLLALQAKATSRIFGFGKDVPEQFGFFVATWGAAHTSCKNLDLPSSALDATILTAHVEESGNYAMTALGDGFLVGRTKKGDVIITEINFPSNAPIYPRLIIDEALYQSYSKEFGRKIKVITTKLTPANGSYEKAIVSSEEWELPETRERGGLWYTVSPLLYNSQEMEVVALYSDGAASFQQYDRMATGTKVTQVPAEEIIWETMSFKRYSGNFVHARCDRAFSKFDKLNWRNVDDFSMAAIHVKKEEDNA